MADSTLNAFVARGTNAERVAFTPTPPTPASGNDPGYFFYETDTGNTYAWDGAAWDQVNTPASFASATEVLTGTETAKVTSPDGIAALWEQGSDVASAGTVSLGEGGYFNITGTTTITDIDFATDKAGRKAWVQFAGALTLTHNASTLILPTGANITTAAGDTACFVSEGTDVVRCVSYNRADGSALAGGSSGNIGLEYIGPYTPSGVASFDIENFAGLTAYSQIIIVIESLTVSTDTTGLTLQYKLNGSYQSGASSYKHTRAQLFSATTASNGGSAGDTKIELTGAAAGSIGNASGEGASGTITLLNPYDTAGWKRCRFEVGYIDDQAAQRIVQVLGHGAYSGTDATGFALGGVRIAATTGTLSGTVHVYGLVNA